MSSALLRRLEVERQASPLSIDVRRPRFSWIVDGGAEGAVQLAYRLVVLGPDAAAVWDSGRRASSEPLAEPEDDLALASLTDYTWSVEVDVVTAAGGASLTAHCTFGTGALDDAAWAGAEWISGAGQFDPTAPLIRVPFTITSDVVSARLLLAAGGYAVATVNGAPVSEERLSPGITDFDERVPYVVHDVGALVASGDNVLALALGRGFYGLTTENTWKWHAAPWRAEPCVRVTLRVETTAGAACVISQSTAMTSRGGTLADSLYEGEVFDRSREPHGWRLTEFDASSWDRVEVVPGPRGQLRARPYPGIRVIETIAPARVDRRDDGTSVIDFGRQLAGWTQITVPPRTKPGAELVLTHAERLVDGLPEISTPFSEGELQVDRFIAAGGSDTWEPQFGYKGFQYVGVRGFPGRVPTGAVAARVAHTDLARRAKFACSDDLLTWMHEASVATMLNNLHHIPTDTPVFEKNGWTGDAQLAADMMLRDLDAVALLEDWCRSMAESRDADGRPALIAPTPDWHWPEHMEAPPWHSAYVLIPWRIYEATGDDTVLREHAEGIFRYVRLEHAGAVDGISQTGLGDYLAPDKRGNPDEDLRVCATASVYDSTRVAARIAHVLDDRGTEAEMTHQANEIRSAFIREFYDVESGSIRDAIAGFRQTHNILALASGLVPDGESAGIARALADDIDNHRGGHLWVGALGVRRALQVLDDHGFDETSFRAATATDFPSWGLWRAQGATTMWEYWDDQRSRNHYFFGTVDDWLFSHVAGVSATAPGYRRVTIRPRHLSRLDWASAEIETVRGRLTVTWNRERGGGVLSVELPTGCTADIDLGDGERRTLDSGRTDVTFSTKERTAA